MTRLLVVRHAESDWNAAGRWQGRGDPPLSPHGHEQAAAAVPKLRGRVERVVSSALVRAHQTAQLIAGALGAGDVEVETDLVEIDVGKWTGLTIGEVQERYGAELRAWRDGQLQAPPGGEDKDAFLERVVRGLRTIAVRHQGRAVLVVSHGGCIGRLERHLGVFPGRGPGHLAGRWFSMDGEELRPTSDRIELIGEPTAPPPEAR